MKCYVKFLQGISGMTSTVGEPNVFLEFDWLQIIQILQTCHTLFTVDDVLQNVEIWRKHHAVAVLDAVAQIFGDITVEHDNDDMSMFNEDHIDIEMDWEELRDDSSFMSFLRQQLGQMKMEMIAFLKILLS
jgi:hypothetical protein